MGVTTSITAGKRPTEPAMSMLGSPLVCRYIRAAAPGRLLPDAEVSKRPGVDQQNRQLLGYALRCAVRCRWQRSVGARCARAERFDRREWLFQPSRGAGQCTRGCGPARGDAHVSTGMGPPCIQAPARSTSPCPTMISAATRSRWTRPTRGLTTCTGRSCAGTRWALTRFQCEITGITWSPDYRAMWINVQPPELSFPPATANRGPDSRRC